MAHLPWRAVFFAICTNCRRFFVFSPKFVGVLCRAFVGEKSAVIFRPNNLITTNNNIGSIIEGYGRNSGNNAEYGYKANIGENLGL